MKKSINTKGVTITSKTIDKMISLLRSKRGIKYNADFLLVPPPRFVVDRKKYSGTGRPKKSDYVYIDFTKLFKESRG